ncbi:exodeoxyribonuclease V subunit gamma [Marinospirillum sp. MEB164]|uniref:RecBCD enzyme subunit RecC n=1 Tax=Marinospirillum alkalitolerans TaxID=3123374 RepID=A0ABW8PW33_9GAMM
MPASLHPLEPGLMILQGNRLEDQRDLLTQWIQKHPLNPLENETFLVQSNGIAQWLKMALARDQGGCGIAAAMQVGLPGRFLWQAYRSIFAELPEISPFDKAPLTWRLYRLLGTLQADAEKLKPLQGFLSQDDDPRRLHQLAANLADLYDQYQVYRADWLEAWEANKDEHQPDWIIKPDGSKKELAPADAWQPLIWRYLCADIEADPRLGTGKWARTSRASIHQAVIEQCAHYTPDQRPEGLPRRVLVFGISSLPRQTLELLQAISPFTQLMIFAHNPCQHYWGDLVEGKALLRREYRRIQDRKIDASLNPEDLHLAGHPLLAAWGKQGRDYLHLLDEQDEPTRYQERVWKAVQKNIDLYRDPLEEKNCLLTQLQSDLLNLRSLQERQAQPSHIDPQTDTSLQFLIAHSPQREVEILHDQLLAEFEHNPNLPLREVLVMVPDIHVYAPHIQAVFGRYAAQGDQCDPRFLPFHIADQGQRGQNTLLIALEKILHLPSARLTVSELLDLLDTPALRARYDLAETDLPRLKEWIQGANIRWGLNAQQRADLDLPANEQNTWLFGLRRLLLGFAAGDSEAWMGIEPHDEVAGLEAALLGPLDQLLRDLHSTREMLKKRHTPKQWIDQLNQLIQTFFVDTSSADAWAFTNLDKQLDALDTHWQEGSLVKTCLPLEVVREALLSALDQPTLTQKFLGGAINFATLMPMRAIPFQQIWLLGMNDGDYPRSVHSADFDLMAQDYRPGDRSRREDDHYLFLEALLSAREKLVISWVGRNIRDNSLRPPSVLVGQLRDHLAAGWRLAGHDPQNTRSAGAALLNALTSEHPLQPFSRDYFKPDRDPRLFTYAHEWRQLYQSTESTLAEPPLTLWQPEAPITLQQLAAFLRHPVKTFYSQRLGVHWSHQQEVLQDDEAFALTGLDDWSVKDEVIQQVIHDLISQPHADLDSRLEHACQRLQARGRLAFPPFGVLQGEQLHQELAPPLKSYAELLRTTRPAAGMHGRLQASDTLLLEDQLTDLRINEQGEHLRLLIQASRLHQGKSCKWHQLIRQWPAHLFAQLQAPTRTRILGPDTDLTLAPVPALKAQAWLKEQLLALQQGMTQLLPLPCQTAFAALEASTQPATVYESGYRRRGEISEHPAFVRFWPDYDALQQEEAFYTLAERLYQPLIHVFHSSQQEAATHD